MDVLDLFLLLDGLRVFGMVKMGVRIDGVIGSLLIGWLDKFCLLA